MSRTRLPTLEERDRAASGRERRAGRRGRKGRLGAVVAFLALVAGMGVWFLLTPGRTSTGPRSGPSRLVALAVRADPEPLIAVVGAKGVPSPAVMVIPASTFLTIPGQGEGTAGDAALLPGRSFSTAVSNVLGTWIEHFAVLDTASLERIVDAMGGVELAPEAFSPDASPGPPVAFSGAEVAEYLSGTEGAERTNRWQVVLEGLFAGGVRLEAANLQAVDDPAAVGVLLAAAQGAKVTQLPVRQVEDGLLLPDEGSLRPLMTSAFGVPDRAPVPVIVLNGSGSPGVGEAVAERLVPEGFQIVDSENAASFGHRTTAILAATSDDRAVAERIRDLLGVGVVTVAGLPSGLGDVTIVVGKDYTSG